MPTLTLKFKDTRIKTFSIAEGEKLSIGRRETNDIVIENLAVSGFHAKIDAIEKGYLLTDLKSKNGTFVNGQLVSTHWLGHGDVISVGKHTLIFVHEGGKPQTAPADDGMDKTMVMETGQYKELLAKNATEAGGAPSDREPAALLSFLSGAKGEVEIQKKLVKIGKDPSSDIVVGGLMTAKTAATISKRPNGYYISYVGGMAKPKVNDVVVRESIQLKEFDIIEIGPAKMQFIFKTGS